MDTQELTDCIQESEEGSYVDISVSPCSEATEFNGVNPWRKKVNINIAEKAEDGEANKALISFLSDIFAKEDIRIVKGKRSKHKRVFISDLTEEDMIDSLEDL